MEVHFVKGTFNKGPDSFREKTSGFNVKPRMKAHFRLFDKLRGINSVEVHFVKGTIRDRIHLVKQQVLKWDLMTSLG